MKDVKLFIGSTCRPYRNLGGHGGLLIRIEWGPTAKGCGRAKFGHVRGSMAHNLLLVAVLFGFQVIR